MMIRSLCALLLAVLLTTLGCRRNQPAGNQPKLPPAGPAAATATKTGPTNSGATASKVTASATSNKVASSSSPASPSSNAPAPATSLRKPRHVEVKGEPNHFELLVDGQPYFIKGIGFNVDSLEFADEEMGIAKQWGFNSLRLWGQGQANLAGLDLAEKHGLTVVPSWWLSQDIKNRPTARDYSNAKENDAEIRAIVEWVRELKDHPAVLMWGIGNESYHFSNQGEAYCRHMEAICQAIHKEDPNHPVLSVDVNMSPTWDFAKFTPSLDIYGCNTYSGFVAIKSTAMDVNKIMKRPVVFSEFGPNLPQPGAKVMPKLHAQSWVDSWKKGILPAKGQTFGGYFFVFHDGRPDDTWFGIFDYQNKPKPIITQAVSAALAASTEPDQVKITRSDEGAYQLRINGQPFFIKGVSVAADDVSKNTFELAGQMGLNTLRMPLEGVTQPEADLLPGYGIRAVVHIELPAEYEGSKATGRDYTNEEQNKAAIADILAKVGSAKDFPALLMWSLGSETYSNCVHKQEFLKFLNQLCRAMHEADPRHPIFQTTSYDAGVEDFAQFAPDLDALGSNSYAGPGALTSTATSADKKMKKPVVFVVSAFLDEGAGRSNLDEKVKTWSDVEMWKRGVLRSRPRTLGGFFRAWKDTDQDKWGFVRKDGSVKQENVDAVRA
ncbi:MAG: hypothetical protein JO317_03455, partial [Verrucomicrobiae bacterium]|nr:hypothetical protein [Verrucomicrobiae bacterium]